MRSTLGPYRVVDFLGAGGMGSVYRVMHSSLGRIAAAKVLNAGPLPPSAAERFRNEARIHAALHHPHIATMYEYLELDGQPCIVMEFVDGETIDQTVRNRGAMAPTVALRIFADVVDAVGYIHQRGIMHRDLKPNNVKINSLGQAKLLDFGIARAHDSPRLTSDGNVVGTLQYLAPEQLQSGRGDHRSDIWALGILLYEMVTARLPFEGGALGAVTERLLSSRYASPSSVNAGVPREIDRIIARCLRVNPDDRYTSAEALLTDVRAIGESPEASCAHVRRERGSLSLVSGELLVVWRRQGRLVASVVAAAAGVALFGWAVWSDPTPASRPDSPSARTPARPVPSSARPPLSAASSENLAGEYYSALPLPPANPTAEDVSLRPVIIRVLEGQAEVFRDGVRVGETPFTTRLPLGTELSLTLRQPGCRDEPVLLRVAEGSQEYLQNMKCQRNP